ncbi:MAG: cytochrome c [Desulfobulbaceae bacterium]
MKNGILLAVTISCFVLSGLLLTVMPAEAAFGGAKLNNDDCEKCHASFVKLIEENGARHKTEVACLDCHAGTHPPGVEKGSLIPQCANCHEGEPHFTLQNCLGCHRNPHQPLNITLEGEVKPACNTCHAEVVQEIDTHESAHAQVDCSFCHNKHGYKPDCMDCHEPHLEQQKFADCVTCHQVHQPLTLAYGSDVQNVNCGACHEDIRTTLESGSTKHAGFQCVFCHADKHAVVPQCQDCHGEPHNKAMLSKFQSCNECHQSAHSLLR